MRFRVRLLASIIFLGFVAVPAFANVPGLQRVESFAFSDSAANDSLHYVTSIHTDPAQPRAGQPFSIVVEGILPDEYPCGEAVRDTDAFIGVILLPTRTVCTTRAWHVSFPLGLHSAGNYAARIRLFVNPPAQFAGGFFSTFYFTVFDSTPPPPPGPLPYVDFIRVVPKTNIDPATGIPIPRPICPSDSLLFLIGGHFPNTCFAFRRIEVLPIYTIVYTPISYMLRVVVDDDPCIGEVCIGAPTAWSASITLPPVGVAGKFSLGVEEAVIHCNGPIPPPPFPLTTVSIPVSDSCGAPPAEACVLGLFDHPSGPGGCDAFVAPGQPARLVFQVKSAVALSGLQGSLQLTSSGLKITRIDPIVSGMHLAWQPSGNGASFVLFAKDGAPIPASPYNDPSPPVPVLSVQVEQVIADAPPVTFVIDQSLLGSDVNGHEVPQCLFPEPARNFNFVAGRICAGHDCDFNSDGRVNVCDLVLMAHCWSHPTTDCPQDPRRFDCNGDSTFTLDDVLCCAGNILDHRPCVGCPPDSTPHRPADAIRVSFGAPMQTRTSLDVPLRITGALLIGGAKLTFTYPDDRYDVSVEYASLGGDWLHLERTHAGEIVLGLLSLVSRPIPQNSGYGDVSVDGVIHLTLKSGKSPGGELTLTGSEFSGVDAVRLDVSTALPPLSLGGSGTPLLSAAHPNPFTSNTAFTLTLDRASIVSVGIYDLAGRLVVPLYQGPLAAGPNAFVWRGTTPDGSAASNGIYFYRAIANGEVASRKMILLRGN